MRIKALNVFKIMLILFLTAAVYNQLYSEDKVYSWEDCVKTALLNNPDIVSSREAILQKEAAKGVTRSVLLPQISATASGNKTSSSTASGSVKVNNYSYDITAKQLLFDGFKSVYDLKSANKNIDAAMKDYSATSAAVRYDLKSAFVSHLKSREMLKIRLEIEKRRKHILDLVKMKYEGGTEHRGSYYAARADYVQSQADVKSSQRDVLLTKATLCRLMGIDENLQIDIDGKLLPAKDYKEKPDFSSLASGNASYLKSKAATESAMYSLKSSELAFSPELYGTASAGKSGETPDNMYGNWSVGFEITAPLFQGGETWYGYSKSKAAYRQALSDEKGVKNTVMKSLEESWNTLLDSIDNVDVQKSALDAAVERSKIGETQYSIGTLSFDNWTIIESSLASTKKSYQEACAAALVSEAGWIKSKGGTLENESER